jgi:hypothetical protein
MDGGVTDGAATTTHRNRATESVVCMVFVAWGVSEFRMAAIGNFEAIISTRV